MQVEGQRRTSVLPATGARVSNAYTTYLQEGDSLGKLRLIPHVITIYNDIVIKGFGCLEMGVRPIS